MSKTPMDVAEAVKSMAVRDLVDRAAWWYSVAENEGQLHVGDDTVIKKFLRAVAEHEERERRAERGEG